MPTQYDYQRPDMPTITQNPWLQWGTQAKANRLGRREGRAGARAKTWEGTGIGDLWAQREAGLGARSDWYDDWSLWKRFNEGTPFAAGGEARGDVEPSGTYPGVGANLPYEMLNIPWMINDLQDRIGDDFAGADFSQGNLGQWQQALQGIDPRSGVTQGLDPYGGGSAYGQYYGGLEGGALQNIQGMQGLRGYRTEGGEFMPVSQTTHQAGSDIKMLQDMLQQRSQTPLQRGVEQQLFASTMGGLSTPGMQRYQAQSAMLEEPERQARIASMEGLGENYGLWGNRRLEEEMRLSGNMATNRQNIMAGIMQGEFQQAQNYALQSQQLKNSTLGIMSNLAQAGMGARSQAAQSVLGQVQASGALMQQQMGLQFQEAQANIANQFQQAGMYGDMAQWGSEFDQSQQENTWNLINNIMNTAVSAEAAENKGWLEKLLGLGINVGGQVISGNIGK